MKLSLIITAILTIFMATNAAGQSNTQNPDAIVSAFFQKLNQPTVATGAIKTTTPKPTPNRELTPMLTLAKTNWGKLSPKTQSLVSPWFKRPTDPGAVPPIGSITFFPASAERTWASKYFLFHYLDSATSTSANATTLAFVKQVATEADFSWDKEVVTMGYVAPPTDGTLGGSALYDVYMIDIGSAGIYGYVSFETVVSGTYPNRATSFMVLDNDFAATQFGYANPLDPAKVTLAHEFFHSIQMGYDASEFPAFFESLSTWMEDKVYPTIKDNLLYIGEVYVDANGDGKYNTGETFTERPQSTDGKRNSGSQDYPELHLDSFGLSGTGLEQYGRFLWIRYLSDKHGDVVVKDILNATGVTTGNNTYTAIDSVLKNAYNSTLANAFHEFGTWNIDTAKYINGADYPNAWADNLFTKGLNISSDASAALVPFAGKQKHLSTVYELVNNPIGTFTFTTNGNALLSALIQTTSGGAYTVKNIPLSAGSGSWVAPINTAKVSFVISNVSPVDDNMTWKLSDGLTAASPSLTPSTPGLLNPPKNKGAGCITSVSNKALVFYLLLLLSLSLIVRNPRNYIVK